MMLQVKAQMTFNPQNQNDLGKVLSTQAYEPKYIFVISFFTY